MKIPERSVPSTTIPKYPWVRAHFIWCFWDSHRATRRRAYHGAPQWWKDEPLVFTFVCISPTCKCKQAFEATLNFLLKKIRDHETEPEPRHNNKIIRASETTQGLRCWPCTRPIWPASPPLPSIPWAQPGVIPEQSRGQVLSIAGCNPKFPKQIINAECRRKIKVPITSRRWQKSVPSKEEK